MAQTANPRTLCARSDCYRFAVVPPKGYVTNSPVCFAHIERWDSLLYGKEIRKLWDNPKQRKKAKCAFCGFFPLGENTAKLPCCGTYSCCGPSACADPQKPVLYCTCGGEFELSEEEEYRLIMGGKLDVSLYEKVSSVRWFAPWEYIEEIARNSPFVKHPSQLDLYQATYQKMVEKGLDIAKEIEVARSKVGQCRCLFNEVLRKNEGKFDALYSFYRDFLVQLGVNPKITPAFVPFVVRSAFSSFSSGASSETTSQ
jgi:hypothetical protein